MTDLRAEKCKNSSGRASRRGRFFYGFRAGRRSRWPSRNNAGIFVKQGWYIEAVSDRIMYRHFISAGDESGSHARMDIDICGRRF